MPLTPIAAVLKTVLERELGPVKREFGQLHGALLETADALNGIADFLGIAPADLVGKTPAQLHLILDQSLAAMLHPDQGR